MCVNSYFPAFRQDSLYELLQYGQVPASLVSEVLVQYDRAVNEALANRVKTRISFHSVSPGDMYRDQGISRVRGSVCFVLKSAFPPFPPLSTPECKFQNKTCMNL